MKALLTIIKDLQPAKIWLLSLAGCLIAINLNLIGQAKLANLQVTTIIFIAAVFYKIRNRGDGLNLNSGNLSKVLGFASIGLVLFNHAFLVKYDFCVRLLPLISAFCLALFASGIKGLKQYWQEMLLFSVLAIPLERLLEPINHLVGVTTLIAKLSTFILWYVGFEVSRQGEMIILPTKATWVGPNCSGILTMLWMLQLALLFLAIVPTNWFKKILVPLVAVSIVFFVNGIRVAIMAILAAHNYQAFEYWHSDRAQIFSTIPIIIFGLFCQFLIRKNHQLTPKS